MQADTDLMRLSGVTSACPLALLLTLVGAAALQPTSAFAAGEAVAYQGTVQHDGASATRLPASPQLRWSRTFSANVSYAVVARGKAYFTTGGSGSGVTLHAVDLKTGTTVWSNPVPSTYWDVTPAY